MMSGLTLKGRYVVKVHCKQIPIFVKVKLCVHALVFLLAVVIKQHKTFTCLCLKPHIDKDIIILVKRALLIVLRHKSGQ